MCVCVCVLDVDIKEQVRFMSQECGWRIFWDDVYPRYVVNKIFIYDEDSSPEMGLPLSFFYFQRLGH